MKTDRQPLFFLWEFPQFLTSHHFTDAALLLVQVQEKTKSSPRCEQGQAADTSQLWTLSLFVSVIQSGISFLLVIFLINIVQIQMPAADVLAQLMEWSERQFWTRRLESRVYVTFMKMKSCFVLFLNELFSTRISNLCRKYRSEKCRF